MECQARFTVVVHPQTNGQAKVANKFILYGLQEDLDAVNGKWVEELHGVLSLICMVEKTATGEMPLFMLTYGLKAMLPIEVALHIHRLTTFQEGLSNATLCEALDLLPLYKVTHYSERCSTSYALHGSMTAPLSSTLSWLGIS